MEESAFTNYLNKNNFPGLWCELLWVLYVEPLQENIPSAHSLLGFFAYTCGCIIVVEDLHSGSQNHWLAHAEEISTLAVSHDAQVGEASACPGLFDLHHFRLEEYH